MWIPIPGTAVPYLLGLVAVFVVVGVLWDLFAKIAERKQPQRPTVTPPSLTADTQSTEPPKLPYGLSPDEPGGTRTKGAKMGGRGFAVAGLVLSSIWLVATLGLVGWVLSDSV